MRARYLSATVLLLLCTTASVFGDEVAIVLTLDKKGDGRLEVQCAFPPEGYAVIREKCRPAAEEDRPDDPRPPSLRTLLKIIGLQGVSASLVDVDGEFDDKKHRMTIKAQLPGASRMEKDGVWAMSGASFVGPQTQIDDGAALTKVNVGPIRMSYRVRPPAGAANVKMARSPDRLSYSLAAPKDGDRFDHEFEIDVKPFLMSCAAKSYSYDKFPQLCLARATFRNTGTKSIRDYRVRFILADFTTDWSSWARCPRVVPGQTVIDDYFPLINIDRIAQVEGRRPAVLKYEYQFRDDTGTIVVESDNKRLDILGRNEAVYTSLPQEQCRDFHDSHDLIWMVAGSIAGKDDPVVQQLAGMIIGQVHGGLNAAGDDEHAKRLAIELIRFIGHNKISYQTPPWGKQGREFVQHIKYPRDVLANRAGTCIDLALLYASVFEAAGLEPSVVAIPGHMYVAVHLPKSKERLSIECTIMNGDFAKAFQAAKESDAKIAKGLPSLEINLASLRQIGVSPLQLPTVAATFVRNAGYSPAEPLPMEFDADAKPGDAPVRLTEEQTEGQHVDLVVDNAGVIRAAFTQITRNVQTMVYRASVDGGKTWSEPQDLGQDDFGRPCSPPRLIVDGKGRLYCVWKSVAWGSGHLEDKLGTLSVRLFEGGKWRPIRKFGGAEHVVGWFVALGPDGALNVIWSEEVQKSHFGAFSGATGAMLIFRTTIDGEKIAEPKLIHGKRAVYPVNDTTDKYDGYRNLRGYIAADGAVRFAAEKFPSPGGRNLDLELVYFDGKSERTMFPVKQFSAQARNFSPTTQFLDAPCEVFPDAAGRDHYLLLDNAASKHRILDCRIGEEDLTTVLSAQASSGAIHWFRLTRLPDGKAQLLVALTDSETEPGPPKQFIPGAHLCVLEFDGAKWSESARVRVPNWRVLRAAAMHAPGKTPAYLLGAITGPERGAYFYQPPPAKPEDKKEQP